MIHYIFVIYQILERSVKLKPIINISHIYQSYFDQPDLLMALNYRKNKILERRIEYN